MRVLSMKCKDVQKKLLDYSEGTLEPKTSLRVEMHLRTCAQCAEELKAFEDTVRLLQRMPIKEPSEEFWTDFTRGIMQNVRRVERTTAPSWFLQFPRLNVAFVAVATILVIVGAVFFIQGHVVKNNQQQIARQSVESNPPAENIDEALKKIVHPKMVEDMLHTNWALIDGQQLSAFDADFSDDTIDFLLEDLTESEKQALLVELERLLQ
ncbi:hypothetical protein U14_05853 [Candidatus Moduliflexus flocculans]|uniref:Putative zinc-finger domain-containing protein n=1 Tax=Candidatus Moduliflexus flocculans TaxID=1499966 RepID=A0A081BT35_9BACT|nr:hypothetical protein U14_05853 [Candidatus Moduliflexus flocculans]